MTGASRTLVVGIGSPHADDQAGWLLIDELSRELLSDVVLKKAATPHDLIDWLDNCDAVHIVDASCDAGDSILRLDLTDSLSDLLTDSEGSAERTICNRRHSSHDVDLFAVIELGRCLGKAPGKMVLWGIPGQHFEPAQVVSASCLDHVRRCAKLLLAELCG